MLLAQLVATSRRISQTAKRLEKIALLGELLRACGPSEIEIAVSFLSGFTRQGNIGIGYSTLQQSSVPPVREATLTLSDVDSGFLEIAAVKGAGADRNRREALARLLGRATAPEQEFIGRLLMGELRQGALSGLMLDGLARAAGVPLERVRRAAMMAGGVSRIAGPLLAEGEAGLSRFAIQLFQPVQPMLAQTAEDASEAIHELGEAALEYKFDGARIQAHKSGDDVKVFSRRSNDVTAAVPEVVEAVRALPARTLVLDGEVLSLNAEDRPQPFQVTMKRFGRKLDVNRMREELPLTPFWFDLIYLDDASLIDESQRRRFGALKEIVPAGNLVPNLVTANPGDAEDFLHAALAHGHEGIMAKATEAGYAAGARGQSWLKIKRARTLDLIVLAAEWGHGRRTGFLSNLHLGARETENGGFAMLGKTFKGLTDEMLAWQTAELLKLEIARDAYTVYVEPKMVVEVAFNEIQISPRYASGLALRFARVKRYRPDKSAADADTFETVQKLAGAV